MQRSVSCSLTAQVLAPAVVELQIAAAGSAATEELRVTVDGLAVEADELSTEAGGRMHVLRAGAGVLEVSYRCEVDGRAEPPSAGPLETSRWYGWGDRPAGVRAHRPTA